MEDDDDFPKLGKDFQKWSDLDHLLPRLNLDTEIFIRHNVFIASLIILSGLLKGDQQLRKKYLAILTPRHFNPNSLPRYFFEKIKEYLKENESIPETVLEKWITEYHAVIWSESPPDPRMFYTYNLRLRQIINFNPTEEQVYQAIELRKIVMKDRGY